MPADLEILFPNLRGAAWEKTSEETDEYNCFAWAANDTSRWWSPIGTYYWPENVQRHLSFDAITAAYGTLMFLPCDDGNLEQGFEKIAIYVNDKGQPTHAARQREDGQWTSKLGNLDDITHTLMGLEGTPNPSINLSTPYGTAAFFLRRPVVADVHR